MRRRFPAWFLIFLYPACSAAPTVDQARPTPSPSAQGAAATAAPADTEPPPTPVALRGEGPGSGATPRTVAPGTVGGPDFSGQGCFPDVPTPIEVTTVPEIDGRRVRIGIEVRATTEAAVVDHRHGQEIDASVDDASGREIWRWSTVAPFVDPYGYRLTYEPGAARRFSVTWEAPGPGAYTVHGFLIGEMVTPEPAGRFICFDEAPAPVG